MSEITPLPTGGAVLLFDAWTPHPIEEITPLPTGGAVLLFEDPPNDESYWSIGTSMNLKRWSTG